MVDEFESVDGVPAELESRIKKFEDALIEREGLSRDEIPKSQINSRRKKVCLRI